MMFWFTVAVQLIAHRVPPARAAAPSSGPAGAPRGRAAAAAVSRPLWRFFRAYVLRRGFLDGYPGLYIAAATAFGVFVRHTRLYEAENGRPPEKAG